VKQEKSELQQLYEQSLKEFHDGQIVKGKIVKIGPKEVLVDIGYKSEGIIPLEEFHLSQELEEGREVDVFIESIEDEEGRLILSREKARRLSGWDKISSSFKENDLIDGFIKRKVKGGFIIDAMGIDGFLPASLSAFKGLSDKEIIGKLFKFKIVKIHTLRKSLIVSRKDALQVEKEIAKEKLWQDLKIGEIYSGTVKNITDFGAFIDLGGVDGLLHITDMSWSRISHPSEIVAVGDKIEVMILAKDEASKKVSLGLKQRTPDPWSDLESRFPVGTKVKGKIVNILPYGIFVEIEKGIEGLVHISEISWSRRNIVPQEMFSIGETVEVQVLNIDRENRRISLSIRQLEANPWEDVEKKLSIGMKVEGKISGFTDYGAFVDLGNNLEGMIHVSDMSWKSRVTNPQEILKKGQKIEAVILAIDSKNRKITLGLKQLEQNPWPEIARRMPVGTVIDSAEVVSKSNYGVFVKIDNELEGLIFPNEIEKSLLEKIKPHDKIKVKIIKIDQEQGKIGLTANI